MNNWVEDGRKQKVNKKTPKKSKQKRFPGKNTNTNNKRDWKTGEEEEQGIIGKQKDDTLLSKATVTSKTFIVPKVFIFKNPD